MWRLRTCSDESPTGGSVRSLNGSRGRQVWWYDEDVAPPPWYKEELQAARDAYSMSRLQRKHAGDIPYRLQCRLDGSIHAGSSNISEKEHENVRERPSEGAAVSTALSRGIDYMHGLQMESGHLPGDYGGPMFLLPGLLIACSISKTELPAPYMAEMRRYLEMHQNGDGGWGLHIEGPSTMFGSALNYVALRLLGAMAGDESCVKARTWIRDRGGALGVPSWGKFWLACLGVYDWSGMNPITPEFWLLPYWFPAHPGRFWCHCRMVYLPMSYLYGRRAVGPLTDLVMDLRDELYVEPYDKIEWPMQRNNCYEVDYYYKRSPLQNALWTALYHLENVMPAFARKRALARVMEIVHHEDENTRFVCIGPVNKAMNMLCCWFDDPAGDAFLKHVPRVYDYLWLAEDGMKMQGYNGSQLWDTAFAVQAVAHTGLSHRTHAQRFLARAYGYLDSSQVKENVPELERFYRHVSDGAWPFSTQDHGWPIADCSADGLKAVLCADEVLLPENRVNPISDGRLAKCVDLILSFQNTSRNRKQSSYSPGPQHWPWLGEARGGWATYENTRGSAMLEFVNPSECFGGIIVDYSYVELTSAAMTALLEFRKRFPEYRQREVTLAIQEGRQYVLDIQRPDGSWYGSWGVCFTYGAWFGIKSLVSCGDSLDTSAALRKAVSFLLGKQHADGGWGESYLSCHDKAYTQAHESQVVNTAWAVLALIHAGQHKVDVAPVEKAVAFLVRSQESSGDWPQQLISGVFNNSCMITYANYRLIFPIWALGCYRTEVLGHE